MPDWLHDLFTKTSIAQSVVIYGLVIAAGIWLGRIKIAGISLGITWVLFAGLLFSYSGVEIDKNTEHFIKEFGLILFVYSIGLQVGPGFWASLKKNALVNNLLALAIVGTGVLITVILYLISGNSISVMAGVMSGAVTIILGLATEQAAVNGAGPLDQFADIRQPDTRACSVVHQYEIIRAHHFGQRIDAGQHRIAALRSTDSGEQRLAMHRADPWPIHIRRPQHHQQTGNLRMCGKPFQRVFDQRPSGQRQILLGAIAADPRAAPGGRHHAPHRWRIHGEPAEAAVDGDGALPARAGCSTI